MQIFYDVLRRRTAHATVGVFAVCAALFIVGYITWAFHTYARATQDKAKGSSSVTQCEAADVASNLMIKTPASYQTFQRDSQNVSDIRIAGTYRGAARTIEASWNGAPYTVIATVSDDGTYVGVLYDQPAGQGALHVRAVGDTTTPGSCVEYVGVGDVFVVAGQSNASGRGETLQHYESRRGMRAVLFGNDDTWKELSDPFDSATHQVDAVSIDAAAGGSFVPLLATMIMRHENIPVAFIPAVRGGTTIAQWQPSDSPATLYGSMKRRIQAVGGTVRAVLWYQGENDAKDKLSSRMYRQGLYHLASQLAADFPGTRMVVGQIGHMAYAPSALDAIRYGQTASWKASSHIVQGPLTYDINLADEGGDTLHFRSDADVALFAERWWESVRHEVYGAKGGTTPTLSGNVMYSRTTQRIYMRFSESLSGTLPSAQAFTLHTSAEAPVIVEVELIDEQTVALTLQGAVPQDLSVSYASGNTAVGNALYDVTRNMPALPFYDIPVQQTSLPKMFWR